MFYKVRKKVKLFYKNIIILFFSIIYSKPQVTYKKKNFFKISKIKIDKNNYKIYELQKGRVYTNKNDVTAYITKEN